MDGEDNGSFSLMKNRVERQDLSNTGYYYNSLVAQAHKKCTESCVTNFKASNLSLNEKNCIKNCINSFHHVNNASFFSMQAALCLHDMEKAVTKRLNNRLE